jgi:hypothetical protein
VYGRLKGLDGFLYRHLVAGPENEIVDNNDPYFSIIQTLCPTPKRCLYEQGGRPFQFDRDHLTDVGSVFVANAFRQWLQSRQDALASFLLPDK